MFSTVRTRLRPSLLTLFVLLQPRHLDRLQLPFRRRFRIILELFQLGDPLVQVGIPDVRRIQVRELFVERQRDVIGAVPSESRHQILVPFSAPRTAVFIIFSASLSVTWLSCSIFCLIRL